KPSPTRPRQEARRRRRLRRAMLLTLLAASTSATGIAVWIASTGGTGRASSPSPSQLPGPPSAAPHIVRGLSMTRHRVNLYAFDRAGMISAAARRDPPRIYVPNSESNTVDVIDPRTFKIVDHFAVGALPQHITPSYD